MTSGILHIPNMERNIDCQRISKYKCQNMILSSSISGKTAKVVSWYDLASGSSSGTAQIDYTERRIVRCNLVIHT